MNPKVTEFHDGCTELISDVSKFMYITRAIELQEESALRITRRQEDCNKLKDEVIALGDEESANALLSIWHVLNLHRNILSIWINIKKDNMSVAWEVLVDAQMDIHFAMSAHGTGKSVEHLITYLEAIEKLLFPPVQGVSPRFITKRTKCSICGKNYASCEHIKGKAYWGTICAEVIEEAQLLDVSLVDDPANKRARNSRLQRKRH